MTFQLEYTCTEAERNEAQTLQLRQRYGRGSKWLTRLVLFGLLALVLIGAYFKVQHEMTPQERPWFIGLALVVFIVVFFSRRLGRGKNANLIRLEVSEREVVLQGSGGRIAMPWTAFSRCLESANLFVLVDRPKGLLFLVPKRAFPDEAAREWFRAQANQPQSPAPAVVEAALAPGRFVGGQGIAFSLQLTYRDYLVRTFTSWRLKGLLLVVFALTIGFTLFAPPPPGAVNSPLKVSLIMSLIFGLMAVVLLPFVAFVSWRTEKKYLVPQQLVLSEEGIDYANQDGRGRLAWSAFKYFRETRWCFFIWQPGSRGWFMFPKREFATASEVDQVRGLLQSHLKRSRWFYL